MLHWKLASVAFTLEEDYSATVVIYECIVFTKLVTGVAQLDFAKQAVYKPIRQLRYRS